MAADLYSHLDPPAKHYYDKRRFGSLEEFEAACRQSTTLYVGNLSAQTAEGQLLALFGMAGPVRRVIMGLDRLQRRPCGFAFVEYHTRQAAVTAHECLNNTKLDNRVIRVSVDPGFVEGRQYGRGATGGQMRDDLRKTWDGGRDAVRQM